MAKWGEGDPRWIVEKREDGANVNNWHWSEKNANSWSQNRLKELIENLEIDDNEYNCTIKELTSIEGEATVNNRKAKLIFLYEWVIKGSWSGSKSNGKTVKGKFEILNLSDENPDVKDIDVSFTIEDDKEKDAYEIKQFMRKIGEQKIREKLSIYIKELKEEFSKGLILPTHNPSVNSTVKEVKKLTVNNSVSSTINKSNSKEDKLVLTQFESKESFKCEVSQLYRALTEKNMVSVFTRSNAFIEPTPGGKFILFDGNVLGEFVDLVLNEKLVMKWRFKEWPEKHFSTVTLDFKQNEDNTELYLKQFDIPAKDLEKTQIGWKNYYWHPIMQRFGFGSGIYA